MKFIANERIKMFNLKQLWLFFVIVIEAATDHLVYVKLTLSVLAMPKASLTVMLILGIPNINLDQKGLKHICRIPKKKSTKNIHVILS